MGMDYIPLSGGCGVAVVDDDDYEMLCLYRWSTNDCGYMQAYVDGRHCTMHRLIMNAQKGQELDHINRVKADNRKANLRWSSRRANSLNKENSYGEICTGVTLRRDRKRMRWQAQIYHNGKHTFLGNFANKKDAENRYLEALHCINAGLPIK